MITPNATPLTSSRLISFRAARMCFILRTAFCLAAAGLASSSARALEILGDPVLRYIAPYRLEVRWQTDQPSDSRVDYAFNPQNIMTVSSPAPVTDHVLVIQTLQPGQPYNFFIRSTAGVQVAEAADFLYNAPVPVVIQEPARSQPTDPPPLATGVTRITAAAAHPSIQIQSVTFLYVPPGGGQPVTIGVDTDGAGIIANTFETAVTGDGWSVQWDTTNLPEGGYNLIAQLTTSIGVLQATSDVYVDHQPPDPVFLGPGFGSRIRGSVTLNAQGGQGIEARFEYQGPVSAVLLFSPMGLAQTNFPYDGNRGRMMCDPTSEASILLGIAEFRMALLANAAFQKALKKCTNGNSALLEDCIRKILIKALATQKGTGSTGTSRDGEIAGSNGLLKGLGLNWNYTRKKEKQQNDHSYTVAQLKACSSMDGVQGVVVHVAPCNNMSGTGHAMALKSINDMTNADGSFTVTFMDPATGMDAPFNVAPGGRFTYGTRTLCIRSMGMFTKPPAHRLLTEAGWQPIGTDVSGADGWNAVWKPAGLAPGFYWLRVLLTDERGRSGQDFTEVFFAPPLLTIARNGANVVVRWSTNAPNYDLEFATTLPAVIWSPVVQPTVVQGDQNTVTMGTGGAARYLRLRER